MNTYILAFSLMLILNVQSLKNFDESQINIKIDYEDQKTKISLYQKEQQNVQKLKEIKLNCKAKNFFINLTKNDQTFSTNEWTVQRNKNSHEEIIEYLYLIQDLKGFCENDKIYLQIVPSNLKDNVIYKLNRSENQGLKQITFDYKADTIVQKFTLARIILSNLLANVNGIVEQTFLSNDENILFKKQQTMGLLHPQIPKTFIGLKDKKYYSIFVSNNYNIKYIVFPSDISFKNKNIYLVESTIKNQQIVFNLKVLEDFSQNNQFTYRSLQQCQEQFQYTNVSIDITYYMKNEIEIQKSVSKVKNYNKVNTASEQGLLVSTFVPQGQIQCEIKLKKNGTEIQIEVNFKQEGHIRWPVYSFQSSNADSKSNLGQISENINEDSEDDTSQKRKSQNDQPQIQYVDNLNDIQQKQGQNFSFNYQNAQTQKMSNLIPNNIKKFKFSNRNTQNIISQNQIQSNNSNSNKVNSSRRQSGLSFKQFLLNKKSQNLESSHQIQNKNQPVSTNQNKKNGRISLLSLISNSDSNSYNLQDHKQNPQMLADISENLDEYLHKKIVQDLPDDNIDQKLLNQLNEIQIVLHEQQDLVVLRYLVGEYKCSNLSDFYDIKSSTKLKLFLGYSQDIFYEHNLRFSYDKMNQQKSTINNQETIQSFEQYIDSQNFECQLIVEDETLNMIINIINNNTANIKISLELNKQIVLQGQIQKEKFQCQKEVQKHMMPQNFQFQLLKQVQNGFEIQLYNLDQKKLHFTSKNIQLINIQENFQEQCYYKCVFGEQIQSDKNNIQNIKLLQICQQEQEYLAIEYQINKQLFGINIIRGYQEDNFEPNFQNIQKFIGDNDHVYIFSRNLSQQSFKKHSFQQSDFQVQKYQLFFKVEQLLKGKYNLPQKCISQYQQFFCFIQIYAKNQNNQNAQLYHIYKFENNKLQIYLEFKDKFKNSELNLELNSNQFSQQNIQKILNVNFTINFDSGDAKQNFSYQVDTSQIYYAGANNLSSTSLAIFDDFDKVEVENFNENIYINIVFKTKKII